MRCDRVGTLLPEYLEDALTPRQSQKVETHLAGCEACREELRLLQRALLVLDAGARSHHGIDLWAGLQQKLAEQQRSLGRRLSCVEVQDQLCAYLDGELSVDGAQKLQGHLLGCPACSAERRLLENSLRVMDTATTAAPPDNLWPQLERRLQASQSSAADRLSCDRVMKELPAYLDEALSNGRREAVTAHLEACALCSRDVKRLRATLARLDALPPAPLPRDLWPEFQARLLQEPAASPRWTPAWPAAGGLLRGLGMAAAATAVLVFGVMTFAGEAPHLLVAQNPPTPAAPAPVETVLVAPLAENAVSLQTVSQPTEPVPPLSRSSVGSQPMPVFRQEPATPKRVPQLPVEEVVALAPMEVVTELDISSLMMALAPAPETAVMEINTDEAHSQVMPEVVAALEQIVKVSDSFQSPFEVGDDSF